MLRLDGASRALVHLSYARYLKPISKPVKLWGRQEVDDLLLRLDTKYAKGVQFYIRTMPYGYIFLPLLYPDRILQQSRNWRNWTVKLKTRTCKTSESSGQSFSLGDRFRLIIVLYLSCKIMELFIFTLQ